MSNVVPIEGLLIQEKKRRRRCFLETFESGLKLSISLSHHLLGFSALCLFPSSLVQLFWLTCIKKLLSSSSKLSWSIIVPIGIVSLAAFSASIAVGALSITEGPFEGDWPLEKTGELSKTLSLCLLSTTNGV